MLPSPGKPASHVRSSAVFLAQSRIWPALRMLLKIPLPSGQAMSVFSNA